MGLKEQTVGQLLKAKAQENPEQTAYIYPERSVTKSYRTFDEETDALGRSLMAYGIEQGDHVAVWSDNKEEWLQLMFALAKIGAVLVTINTSYQKTELEYILSQSDAKMLILTEQVSRTNYRDIVLELVPELAGNNGHMIQSAVLPRMKTVVAMRDFEDDRFVSWQQLNRSTVTAEAFQERVQSLDFRDVINIQYTSGTTGFPKGVMLTHYNIVNNGSIIGGRMNYSPDDIVCIPVPFFHCFGCVLGVLAAVNHGAAMVIIESFKPDTVLQAVQDHRCTSLLGVPTMFIAELNTPNFSSYNTQSLRTGIMAGSICPVEVMKKVMSEMGANEITICYGQTESSPVITQTTTDDPIELKVSSVGKVHPNVEARVINPETGEEVPPGTPGELVTRGYLVMKGYYKNPEATAAAIDHDGWLHTGDIAVMDDNGYFSITGRIKDMVIRGGENIYPREIEEYLYEHPAIQDAQVVGVPDAKYGEELIAYIILKDHHELSADDVKTYYQGRIAHYKIPRYIEFVTEYPMTASGKIQKFKLRELAQEFIAKEED
ncbi:AMP-binding protein [Macrococcus equipercicus]|uniref:Putative long chain fatty acid-CoA ligase VraA n=1 Tax=Macrococcus equipercicus TaxID=69967 RepID=A0A9Q9F2Y6_9STAP|nr:AMP-binding protein [Macrococcus equipercicus]UTH14876.1 AMP-binding protein [Macrococcus equipercicus]